MGLELPRTAALMQHLGRHHYADDPLQLTLPELGSLLITAGVESGFVVQVEVPVIGRATMDCIWTSIDGTRVAAFEFDGRDVAPPHILGREEGKPGNRRKFAECGALVKVQALYSLRNERVLPRPTGATDVLRPEVHVVRDEKLMAAEVVTIAQRAVGEAIERGLTLLR